MEYVTIVSFLLLVILYSAWKKFIKSGPIYKKSVSLAGKTVLITGGSNGLGKAVAMELAKRHARVIIASRSEVFGLRAVAEIKSKAINEEIVYMQVDLSDMNDIRRFVRHFVTKEPRLDILVNNAGCISLEKTKDGLHGRMFATNVLGPFLLTQLLLPLLEETGTENPTRIVNIASEAYLLADIDLENIDPHFDEETPTKTILSHYSSTKLMVIYLTTELNKRLQSKQNSDVTVYALHPGTVNSNLGMTFASRGILWLLLRKMVMVFTSRAPYYCAQSVLYCCLQPEIEGLSGEYFSEMKHSELWPHAKDSSVARKLWKQLDIMAKQSTDSVH